MQAASSVPPDMLMMGTRSSPTTSESQRYGPGFHGSPVVRNVRSVERSWRRTGSAPCGTSARTSVGERPRIVTRSRSQSSQRRSGPGQSGAPSMKTTVAPSAPEPTTVQGPMIQPMSVAKRTRSPGRASAS